jgi:hypothetical protein
LVVIYVPFGSPHASIESAMSRLGERLSQFAGAAAVRSTVQPSRRV